MTSKKSTHDNLAFEKYWKSIQTKHYEKMAPILDELIPLAKAVWQAAISSKQEAVTSCKSFDEYLNKEYIEEGAANYHHAVALMLNDLQKCWTASRSSVIAEVSVGLPEKRSFNEQRHDEVDSNFIMGFNKAIDEIRARLEKELK